MSILIPDMKMPKSCPCELAGIGYDSYCSFAFGIPARVKQYEECCESRTKPDWCPLNEVATPHGRLIEEPKRFDYGGLAYISPDDVVGIAKYFLDQIRAMPTIIEAEGTQND